MGIFRNLKEVESCRGLGGDFWTNFCHKFSVPLVAAIQYTKITPNQLTIGSCLVALLAAILTTKESYGLTALAGILVQVAYILDCADGQLARYKNIFSPLGPWLDIFSDRIREFVLIVGLTVRFSYTNEHAWFFGLYSMFLLFLYHGEANIRLPLTSKEDKQRAREMERGIIKKVMRFREKLTIGAFYIGEQYLIISLFLILNRVDLLFYVFTAYGSVVVFTYPFYKYYHYRLLQGKK